MGDKLDFSGRTQLYFQLYDILLEKINAGEYKPGELLPTESQLINDYGISRATVRKAMDLLLSDGLIIKRQGHGTYVQPKQVEQTMKRVLHFSEEMAKKGYTYSTNMLSNELVPASRTIAKALQIEEGCPLVRVTRLRYANGVPMCMEIAHLVYERCPGVYGTDFSQTSLRNFLSEEYNIVWSSARQRIYAINASTKIAGHLDVKEHGALIYIERVSCPADGKPGEYLEGYYRGDSYYLTTELQA